MAIADKIQRCIESSSWIRKMFEEGAKLRQIHGAENVYDFTLGNPNIDPPERFYDELRKISAAPEHGQHRYMSNAGYDITRDSVASFITSTSGVNVQRRNILMTCGASGALNVSLKTMLNPGDEVIILTPYFVEYKFYIDNHGGVPIEVWTDRETFQLDIQAIENAVTGKTRAIIINTPNNPTGVIYPAESLKSLGIMLERKQRELERQIYLISDEPYARISFDSQDVPNIFRFYDNSLIVTSHSKDLALPGERIGYIATSPTMVHGDLFMEGAIFCNRTLGFVNAPALMQRLVANLQNESIDIAEYREKRDLFYENLTAMGFSMVKPDGAFYLFPKSPIPDDVTFVRTAQKHNLLLVPGAGFGAPGYFRVAYCVEIDSIRRSFPAWKALATEFGLNGDSK